MYIKKKVERKPRVKGSKTNNEVPNKNIKIDKTSNYDVAPKKNENDEEAPTPDDRV